MTYNTLKNTAALTLAMAAFAMPAFAGDDVVRIGVPTALTGAYGDLGAQVRRAVELAVEEANEEGGVDGKMVEVQFLDTQAKAEMARQQSEKLIDDGYNLLLGAIASGEALAIGPMLERWDALYISTINKADSITGADCSPRMFRVNHPDASDAATVKPWLNDQPETNWAVMGSDTAWGRNSGDSFGRTADAVGKVVVSDDYAGLGTNDFAPYIQKIIDSGAEGLWVALAGRDAVNFAQQAKQFGLIDRLKVAGVSFVTDNTVNTLGDTATGIYGIVNYSSTLDTEANAEFVAAWSEKYPGSWPTNFEGETYLGMQVLLAAVDAADSTAPEDVAAAMSGLEVDTIVGNVLMRAEDHQLVRNNYFGQVEEYDGILRPVIATEVLSDLAMAAPNADCRL